jgi:hypothetical protein
MVPIPVSAPIPLPIEKKVPCPSPFTNRKPSLMNDETFKTSLSSGAQDKIHHFSNKDKRKEPLIKPQLNGIKSLKFKPEIGCIIQILNSLFEF